jgi:TolA-binding protein
MEPIGSQLQADQEHLQQRLRGMIELIENQQHIWLQQYEARLIKQQEDLLAALEPALRDGMTEMLRRAELRLRAFYSETNAGGMHPRLIPLRRSAAPQRVLRARAPVDAYTPTSRRISERPRH